mmetsp:Transcript_37026/g.51392  ORF Transcript_37026/g.51392 Transcript_37026/m.51392 type:complete len:283 (-) Transcript_37026:136-984(-)
MISGTVFSSSGECEFVVPGAVVHVWQANHAGVYDDNSNPADFECRSTILVDGEGRFSFETSEPGFYAGRPRHIHFKIEAEGHRTLVTQLYFSHDDLSDPQISGVFSSALDMDRVFAVRTDTVSAGEASNGAPLSTATFDIVMQATTELDASTLAIYIANSSHTTPGDMEGNETSSPTQLEVVTTLSPTTFVKDNTASPTPIEFETTYTSSPTSSPTEETVDASTSPTILHTNIIIYPTAYASHSPTTFALSSDVSASFTGLNRASSYMRALFLSIYMAFNLI